MTIAVLSLGSNLGDSKKILNDAIADIKNIDNISNLKLSPFYKTKPVGYAEQDDFLNLACSFETTIKPIDLLHIMQGLEKKYKRIRLFKNGPRTLDIDIVLYGNDVIQEPELTVPHPRMHQRAFVLAPLNDIEPDLIIRTFNTSVRNLYAALDDKEKQGVQKLNG